MSPSNDPFAGFDAGQTFVMPTPGARPAAMPSPAGPAGFTREAAHDIAYHPAGLNPLVAAANPLLNMIPQMRQITIHQDVAGLRDNLAQGLRQFESAARAAGISNEKVIAARYILCTVLDETAASTPWGGSGVWGRHSLLVMFHNEAWGGEKVFQLLTRLAQTPAENVDLLELLYACIALGFEGRYRVVENGRTELQVLRERLAQLIRRERGQVEPALAQHWAPTVLPKRRWSTAMPLWIFTAVAALLLLGGYMGFSYALNQTSDPLFNTVAGMKALGGAPPPAPVPAQKPRLAHFLAPEIQEGLVEVRDFDDRSIVTVRGDGLFAPGSADLDESRIPLMLRIGDAINSVSGLVMITGHTDNQAIRSARYPSNWHLSQDRAKSVLTLLARKVNQVNRLQAEGRADSEPVAPNDSAAGRAKNRRVEITVFVSKPNA